MTHQAIALPGISGVGIVDTVTAKGFPVLTFSVSEIKRQVRAEGFSGKDAVAETQKRFRSQLSMITAVEAGDAQEHGLETVRLRLGFRADGRRYHTITREEPKVGTSERLAKALQERDSAKAELEAIRLQIADAANRENRSEVEAAPAEPTAPKKGKGKAEPIAA